MRILIADDDAKFRGLLRRLLAGKPEFIVVGEASDGEEAVRLARELEAELVLMDISMPHLDGLQATRRIMAAKPATKVILLTVHTEEPYRVAGSESGAAAFLVKKTLLSELFRESGVPGRDLLRQVTQASATDRLQMANE